MLDGLSEATLTKAETIAKKFFSKVVEIIHANSSSNSKYIYGNDITLLECSLVPFVARLDDVKRQYLVPNEVERICRPLIEGKIWREMTRGEPTWHYLGEFLRYS